MVGKNKRSESQNSPVRDREVDVRMKIPKYQTKVSTFREKGGPQRKRDKGEDVTWDREQISVEGPAGTSDKTKHPVEALCAAAVFGVMTSPKVCMHGHHPCCPGIEMGDNFGGRALSRVVSADTHFFNLWLFYFPPKEHTQSDFYREPLRWHRLIPSAAFGVCFVSRFEETARAAGGWQNLHACVWFGVDIDQASFLYEHRLE